MADFEPLPYRLRIGVTGHRKLDDPEQIRAMVEKALATEIDRLFPEKSRVEVERIRREGTTPICFKVLSPLADGSDRIVAEAVLAQPLARLDAVLPLAMDDYLETFESDASRAEFLELLKLSRRPILLRTRRLHEDRHDADSQTELRHQAYVQVGQYVVDHCDVLIAIWDGEPAHGIGGTAEVVQYALDQRRPIIRIWDSSIELLNARNNNGLDASALQAIDQFNRLPIPEDEREKYVTNLDHSYFEKPETARGISAASRELVNKHLFPYYAVASTVAKNNQNRFHQAGKYIYVLSAGAVGCAAFAVLFPEIGWLGFGSEFVILIIMWLTLGQARRTQAQQKWIEYRVLAERLRCGVFMAICGVEPKPFEVLPYLGHSQTVNDWTVRAFDEIWDRLPPFKGCLESDCLMLNSYLREAWLGDQIEFHKKKVKLEGKAREKLANAGEIILPITIVAAAVHIVTAFWKPASTAPEAILILSEMFHKGLSFVALLFPAIAASLAGMESHREHLRLEKSSANMAAQVERVQRQLKPATDPERFEDLIHQATEIMLGETQSWLMLMRFVEIKA